MGEKKYPISFTIVGPPTITVKSFKDLLVLKKTRRVVEEKPWILQPNYRFTSVFTT